MFTCICQRSGIGRVSRLSDHISRGRQLRDDTEAFGMRLAKAGVCVTMQRITEAMHGFTTNRTPGWERALDRQYKFFQEHLR